MRSLPGVDRGPARAAHQPASPARAQRPLDVAQDARSRLTRRCPHPHWVRTERAAMVERARRAASAARPVASGYGMSHGKVFTMSIQCAR
jgi:hypothetical protein